MPPIALSRVALAPDAPIVRWAPRPPQLRNAGYADQFDRRTVFYDVYRVGPHIVFQGPPFLNFLPELRADPWFAARARRTRLVPRGRGNELWVRDAADRLTLDSALGRFDIAVQPDGRDRFAGQRVLTTLSKDNDIAWIRDWIDFYRAEHGADAVLFYDNASTRYTADELRAELRAGFPDMAIGIVAWPFLYGPQGGMAGAVDGVETDWDSDFCQTGSLQHARFRFLTRARSVLNVDIDELVLSDRGRSIFAAAEAHPAGLVRFPGRWIAAAAPHAPAREDARHADFAWHAQDAAADCPAKWCLAPGRRLHREQTWSVHNVFGAYANRWLSREFTYRHMKAISNNWKGEAREPEPFDRDRFVRDDALFAAFERTGLARPR